MAGGFVGVDVFFALSGYLITGILVAEVEKTGTVDLVRFYARRARRLLPASAVVLLATVAFAYVFYSPSEQGSIAHTALWTASYLSNVSFARGATDYFAAGAHTNPLLHTWSLAVEEQFYVLWPLLVAVGLAGVAALRPGGLGAVRRRRLAWVMAAVAAVSFALTLYLMATRRAHWAFFLTPARAWEFALGGLGALVPLASRSTFAGLTVGGRPVGPALTRWAGWAGLAAVVGAGVGYTATTSFPGWAALVPVVGAVLVLRAGGAAEASSVSRALSWRPLREAGRLSYSWYLWHWPVFVFAEGLYGEQPLGMRLALLVLSLGLAELSYRLVEDPVRHHRWVAATSARGLVLLAGLTVLGGAASVGFRSAAAAGAALPDQQRIATETRDAGRPCLNLDTMSAERLECILGDTTSQTTVVLFGDSHADHWLPAVERLAEARSWRLVTMLKSACGVVDASRWHSPIGRMYVECDEWRRSALTEIARLRPALVIAASANSSYNGLPDGEATAGTARVFEALGRSSSAVLHIRDTPSLPFDAAACLERAQWRGQPLDGACTFARGGVPDVERMQAAAARRSRSVVSVDLDSLVCRTPRCSAVQNGHIVYRDRDHLTTAFAASLAPRLLPLVDRLVPRTDERPGQPAEPLARSRP